MPLSHQAKIQMASQYLLAHEAPTLSKIQINLYFITNIVKQSLHNPKSDWVRDKSEEPRLSKRLLNVLSNSLTDSDSVRGISNSPQKDSSKKTYNVKIKNFGDLGWNSSRVIVSVCFTSQPHVNNWITCQEKKLYR